MVLISNMAASRNWRSSLNDHKIFQCLRQHGDKLPAGNDSQDIVSIRDGEIFIWNAYNSSVITTNLKFLVGKNEREIKSLSFQTLLCTEPPTFEVESVNFSDSGAYLALIGRGGVSVLELPQKWGKHGEFEGGKERILCRTTPLGERLFVSGKNKVLHAAWHPASALDIHMAVLTSDNTIRIFNLKRPDGAERTYRLDPPGGAAASPSRLRIQHALGEAACGFDFAPPVKTRHKRHKASGTEEELLWPIFVLWGNGDVYMLPTTLSDDVTQPRGGAGCLEGPLSMYPPAEDNYGTDACAVVCLATAPPTLVIATSEGKLHHCIVLGHDATPDDTKSELTSVSSSLSLYDDTMTSQRLYVYETVELELCLATPSLDNSCDVMDEFSCPIRLHKDAVCKDRYHCSHSAGVHTVALPWQQRFQQFCDDEALKELPEVTREEQSIVEHLVCTRPLPTSAPSPVLGLCVCADRLLGCSLVCLTAPMECLVLPLVSSYKSAPPPLLSDSPVRMTSPLRRLSREPFDEHVRKILQRSASNPLIKTQKTELSPQECLQLLSRATQVFREEYVQKQDLAREVIQKRARVLREHKEQQRSDVAACQTRKNVLVDRAQALAERYDDCGERQQQIIHRVETVLKKLQAKLPVLSDAEKNMQKELGAIEDKLHSFKANITQLKSKQEYQARQISTRQKSRASSSLTRTQAQQIRTHLKQEGDDIAEMVKQVNALRVSIDTSS